MTKEELAAIEQRNEEGWRLLGVRPGYGTAHADIDALRHQDLVDTRTLIAEVKQLTERYDHLSIRCEGVHNRLVKAGWPCGTFCSDYLEKRLAERQVAPQVKSARA